MAAGDARARMERESGIRNVRTGTGTGAGGCAGCGHRLAVNTLQNPDNWCRLNTMFFSALCIMLDIAWGGPAKPGW